MFATSGGGEPECINVMRDGLEAIGYEVVSTFDCRGQVFLVYRGHPDEDDLRVAGTFAAEAGEHKST